VSAIAYVLGVAWLALAIVPIAVAARALRRGVLPDWTGAPGVLVESILGLVLLLMVCQLLGAIGLLRWWAVLPASMATGVTVSVILRRHAPRAGTTRKVSSFESPPVDPIARAFALVLVASVVALWCYHIADASHGIVDYDSLNYHLPFAARFLQTGHTFRLQYTTPGNETPFDPANSELLVAFFMLPFHRDILAPLINLGWLALALLAAYSIGRPRGVGLMSLAAVCVLLGAPLMIFQEVASGSNDIVVVALILAVAAILIQAGNRIPAIAIAGLVAGLGVATKLTLVVPILVLTIAIPFIARRGQRLRTLGAWLVPVAVSGSYWYLRNLLLVGNPIPSLHVGIGNVRLPAPRLSAIDNAGQTVSDYLTRASIWHKFFLPGLREEFGGSWWLLFGLALAGAVAAIVIGHGILRALGTVVIASVIAYIYTPTSASGFRNYPFLFEVNLRYIFPALALALGLLPIVMAPFARRSTQIVVVVAATCALAWQRDFYPGVMVGALLLVGVLIFTVLSRHRRPSRRTTAIVGGAVLSMAVVTGFFVQRTYLDHRYVDAMSSDREFNARTLNAVYQWARGQTRTRIAIAGSNLQYPLFGPDLSNYVQYVGIATHHRGFEAIETCKGWRTAINEGHYDYVVTFPQGLKSGPPREASWTRGTEAHPILETGGAVVFRILGPLDPTGCGGRR
jgi:hypothetical protein